MYQTVIVLAVNAVITIITTADTVRLTTTGRIVSQKHKHRFTTLVRRYGIILVSLLGLAVNTYLLIVNMRRNSPIDRGVILFVSLGICSIHFGVLYLAVGIIYAWLDLRQSRPLA
jgi:hypothetical protein